MMMKMSDINKVFTKKVSEYLAEGCTINVSTMAGSQGEMGKVDLVDDNDHFIRVYMEKVHSWGIRNEENTWYSNTIVIRVGYKYDQNLNDTVWNSRLQIIETITFYEIVAGEWYVDNLEEALEIQAKRKERLSTVCRRLRRGEGTETYYLDNKYLDLATKYLKKNHGYKRVSYKDLSIRKFSYTDHTQYTVVYNGKFFTMQ